MVSFGALVGEIVNSDLGQQPVTMKPMGYEYNQPPPKTPGRGYFFPSESCVREKT
jgi:hypothetical protein